MCSWRCVLLQHCAAVCEAYADFVASSIATAPPRAKLPFFANEALTHMSFARDKASQARLVENFHDRVVAALCGSDVAGQ